MRTTVEMKPEHRSALLALSARRGGKGFSTVLTEAIEAFLKGDAERRSRREEVLRLSGSLTSEDAAALRAKTDFSRERWR